MLKFHGGYLYIPFKTNTLVPRNDSVPKNQRVEGYKNVKQLSCFCCGRDEKLQKLNNEKNVILCENLNSMNTFQTLNR